MNYKHVQFDKLCKAQTSFLVNEVKSLDKWEMTINDKTIVDNLVPGNKPKHLSSSQAGFYDSGALMIDLMGTVFD
jgi:hypothetical protein